MLHVSTYLLTYNLRCWIFNTTQPWPVAAQVGVASWLVVLCAASATPLSAVTK